jgi:putative DNA primase/helicase
VAAASEIAKALGGAHRSGAWWRCRCPVHGSRGATLAVRDGEHGVVIKCFAGCDYRVVRSELRRRGLIAGQGSEFCARPADRRNDHPASDTAHSLAWLGKIWERACDARRSPEIKRYFARRGITIPPPTCLRWLSSCRHPSGALLPAMIARVDNLDGELTGLHRTYLTADYRRYDRASLGLIAGGAVRLAPAAETLLVAEGIETCLAAMQLTGRPGWAALSTAGIRALLLPPIVRTVVIAADNDASGAGEAAARDAAERWLWEDRQVRLMLPGTIGTDFNDELLRGRDGQRPRE